MWANNAIENVTVSANSMDKEFSLIHCVNSIKNMEIVINQLH